MQTSASNSDKMLWEKLYESTSSSTSDIDQPPSFKVIKPFMMKVMDKFSNVGPTGVQFAVLSPTEEDNFYFDEYSNVEGYKAAVRSLNPQRNGTVYLAAYMQDIKDHYFSGEHGGGRPCAERFIFILTDSRTSTQTDTTKIVSDLQASEETIYGIRIGDVSKTILEKMSSFVFEIQDPVAVETFVKSVCGSTLCRRTPEEEAQAIFELPIPKAVFLKMLHDGGRHRLPDSDPVHNIPFVEDEES
ncbi:unnamed protein product [Mytilus coruscus]|uniref:VWFA domain-containing protein n=1 Tax=Mytilus coruscus TaxID=42192 RepID=A0A6J8CGR5_MYTCO|nr:unnamed protein product [Mytilus coruscus]